MPPENPTADTSGASITERLESYLAAQEPTQGETQQPTTSQEETKGAQSGAPDNDTPAEVESTDGDAPSEASEPQISLSDLAKYLGVDESTLDVDDDGSVKVKTKIDGKEGAAKFQDLVKSYQLQGHVDAKAREAAEQSKAFQDRVMQFEQFAQQKAQELNQLAHIAHQELMADAAGIDWQSLAHSDPAGYVAKQAEFQARQARVAQLRQAADQQTSQWQQAQQARASQAFQAEAQRLTTLIPEWADESVREAGKKELATWLTGNGVSAQALASLVDAGMVAALRKAMLAEKGESQKAITEKKVRAAPKLVKPGQGVDAKQREADSLRDLKASIRKSGGKTGIAEYLMASGKV